MSQSAELPRKLTKIFECKETISQSPASQIFKARDNRTDKDVVLKVFHADYSQEPLFQEHFNRNLTIFSRHRQTLVPHGYESALADGYPYVAYDYCDTLTKKLSTSFQVSDAIELTLMLAKILSIAHQQDLLHGNVCPNNIVIQQDGSPRIVDFGIHEKLKNVQGFTPNLLVEHAHYVSPQLILGRPLDFHCDIYSLGAVLYHLLTGNTPYASKHAAGILAKSIKANFPSLPEGFETVQPVLKRMVSMDEAQKFKSTQELVDTVSRLTQVYNFERTDTRDSPEDKDQQQETQPETSTPLKPEDSASEVMEHSIENQFSEKQKNTSINRPVIPAAVCILLVLSIGIYLRLDKSQEPMQRPDIQEKPAQNTADRKAQPETTVQADQIRTQVKENSIARSQALKINTLLSKAKVQIASSNLLSPPGDNAVESLEQILEIEPNHGVALAGLEKIKQDQLKKASSLADKKNFEAAITLLKTIESRLGTDHQSSRLLKQYELAIKNEETPAKEIQRLEAQFNSQMEQGRITEPKASNALKTAQSILKIDPSSKFASRGIGLIVNRIEARARNLYGRGLYDEALVQAEKGIAIWPSDRGLNQVRDNINASLVDRKKAFDQMLHRAQDLIEQRQFAGPGEDNALALYRIFLAKYPNHGPTLSLVDNLVPTIMSESKTSFANKDFDSAIHLIDQAAIISPDNTEIKNQRALIIQSIQETM